MADVTIKSKKNGPYIVKGNIRLVDTAGNVYTSKSLTALCRCGASTTKPFCDGTHSKIGFVAAEEAVLASQEQPDT